MTDQYENVTDDEFVLRRILNREDYIDLSLNIPVQRNAIAPTRQDIDGVSVYREKFVTPEEVSKSGTNPAGYYVVRFNVGVLRKLGLDVIPDPVEGELLGHALIPQLCFAAKKADKQRYTLLTYEMTKLISIPEIVFIPDH